MSTKLVKGTAVVSLADGSKLGTIDKVYLDPERKEIAGFSFHQGGFLGKTTGMVDASDVHAFGADAVTVADPSVVRSELAIGSRRDALVELESLLKRKVLTEGGTYVGQVVSVRFGHDSHCLTAIEVSQGFFQENRVLPVEVVEQIGAELVVVSNAVCHEEPVRPVERRLVRVA